MVPGLPESRLSDAEAASLPPDSVPAPWTSQVHGTVWVRFRRGPVNGTLPLSAAAFIDYLDGPVGPYREVVTGALLRSLTVHVPFLAVDSARSVHGGRRNWALPKAFARIGDLTADGHGWHVCARARPWGPSLPFRARIAVRQPIGTALVRVRGRARLVVLRCHAEGPTLGPWIGSGRRLGVTIDGLLHIGPPRADRNGGRAQSARST
jgi:hypothetical protein